MIFRYGWILNEYGVEVKSYSSVGHDHLDRNKVFIINNQFVLKIYGKFNNWAREIESLSLIKNSEFRVPYILDYGITGDKELWLLMSKLPGDILSAVEENYDRLTLGALYYEIGCRQARFHKCFTIEKIASLIKTSSIYEDYKSYFNYEKQKNRAVAKYVLSKNYPEQNLFTKAFKRLKFLESKVHGDFEISLCHNDFSGRNIIVEAIDNQLFFSGLIDFELYKPSNIENDISKIIIKTYQKGFSKYYFEGYLSINDKVFSTKYRKEYYLLAACFDICRWARIIDRTYYDEALEMMRLILKNEVNKII
jgi:tRNA A-37 threonylcarbamoyl transferase component Bud32